MATPTHSTNTPQKHLATLSSPAPRSVPPMNFDSPAMLNMLGEGGIGMGISMSGMGMSQMGLTVSQLGRADEDERRRRLQNILSMLNEKHRRVSEEGIIALCKKEGVEFEREVHPDGSVILTLVIGNEAMCDIQIGQGDVKSVKLELASDDDNIFKESGSRILYKSLIPRPGENRINLTLDKFSQNLNKLLRMDKLSAENGAVPCYKAIFGVYKSLKTLFEHEKKIALAVTEGRNDLEKGWKAEREVLCKKSGRPRMNVGYCLGLSLEYWMDRRYIIPRKPRGNSASAKGKERVDNDVPSTDEYPEDSDPETNKIYSLTIECEASPSSMYTPIRIPTGWLSDNIEKAPDPSDADISNLLLGNSAPQIDWLDPKPTYLDGPSTDHNAMNLDNAPGRLPNIRFVARFNPPLVVPLTVYVSALQAVGLEYNPQDLRASTFVGLAIRPGETDPILMTTAGGSTAEVRSEKRVLSVDADGKETQNLHSNSLYVPKLEYSRTLESLPFQHPRQLVELLPILRPFALTTSLLQRSFDVKSSPHKAAIQTSPLSPPLTPKANPEEEKLQLDVTLSYAQPGPHLTLHVPHPLSPSSTLPSNISSATDLLAQLLSTSQPPNTHPPLKIVLDIAQNAEIYVSEQNVVPRKPQSADADVDMEEASRVGEKVKRVGRALDVCGDLGVWGEWLRREARALGA